MALFLLGRNEQFSMPASAGGLPRPRLISRLIPLAALGMAPRKYAVRAAQTGGAGPNSTACFRRGAGSAGGRVC